MGLISGFASAFSVASDELSHFTWRYSPLPSLYFTHKRYGSLGALPTGTSTLTVSTLLMLRMSFAVAVLTISPVANTPIRIPFFIELFAFVRFMVQR